MARLTGRSGFAAEGPPGAPAAASGASAGAAPARAFALAVLCVLAGCGDGGAAATDAGQADADQDHPQGGEAAEAGPGDWPGDFRVDGWDHDPYTLPGDFDRSACASPGTGFLAGDWKGIWTARYTLPTLGSGVAVFRFADAAVPGFADAPSFPPGIRGWSSGTPIPQIVLDDASFFWTRVNESGMTHRVVSWEACRPPKDGVLDGLLARCLDGVCDTGTFHAVRMAWHAGESESLGVDKVASFKGADWTGGLTVNVRVAAGRAYLARYDDGLRIVDVSAAATGGPLTELGHVPADKTRYDIWNDVKVLDDRWALMGSSAHGLVVIDAADPTKPSVVVSKFPAGKEDVNVHSIFLVGHTAYLADITLGGIRIVDLTTPSAPKELGTFATGKSFVHDLTVEENVGYLNHWDQGMVLVDFTDPTKGKELGRFNVPGSTSHASWRIKGAAVGGRTVLLDGDEDWAAHLRVLDVDPRSATYLTEIGSYRIRDEVSIHNILCVGARCYFAWYQDGLRILDLADPTAPKQVGYYNTWDGTGGKSFFENALGVDVQGGLIYLADTERGLLVFKEK